MVSIRQFKDKLNGRPYIKSGKVSYTSEFSWNESMGGRTIALQIKHESHILPCEFAANINVEADDLDVYIEHMEVMFLSDTGIDLNNL